jgi:16S rRNA (guanine966-N2)-methyltransferase
MRVIAGKYRNRNLRVGTQFRPTTDRVRETLFNILQNEISQSVFVDAFAASGSVGIEAISRDASMVYFIEKNRRTLNILEKNLIDCCEQDRWRIFSVDVSKGLQLVRTSAPSVDFLFYDPPYDFDGYSDLLQLSVQIFPESEHILESSSRVIFDVPAPLRLVKERKIGETLLSFFHA